MKEYSFAFIGLLGLPLVSKHGMNVAMLFPNAATYALFCFCFVIVWAFIQQKVIGLLDKGVTL